MTPDVLARFMDKISPEPNTGCWIWTAAARSGYGILGVKNKVYLAHRLSYLHFVDPQMPIHLDVCHKCDFPPCVNPTHLFAGTAKDNVQDMMTKGRNNPPRGEAAGCVKLTEQEVIQIREEYATGAYSLRALGDKYNVSHTAIRYAKDGLSWAWL